MGFETVESMVKAISGSGLALKASESRKSVTRLALSLLVIVMLVSISIPQLSEARNAYIANSGSDNVSVVDLATNTLVGGPIGLDAGAFPSDVAITPDGSRAYVTEMGVGINKVYVIDTSTNTVDPVPINTESGGWPFAIAISPVADRAYVANLATSTVNVIDTETNLVVASPAVGSGPMDVAVSPDGARVYVANQSSSNVSVIDASTNTVVRTVEQVATPRSISFTPDGSKAYVSSFDDEHLYVIDTNSFDVEKYEVGGSLRDITISPDGSRAYFAVFDAGTVVVFDTETNLVVASPAVGSGPTGIAIAPDGARAYVSNKQSNSVSVIDTATNLVLGDPFAVGGSPQGLSIVPNQGPTAQFSVTTRATGEPTSFDASGSSDPDGQVATYEWDFGDGSSTTGTDPNVSHTYSTSGNYTATLVVKDNEGGSTGLVYTGKTAYQNGSDAARKSVSFTVADRADEPPTTPTEPPTQQPTSTGGSCTRADYTVRAKLKRSLRIGDLRKGVKVKVSSSHDSLASVKVTINKRDLKRLGLSSGNKKSVSFGSKKNVKLVAGKYKTVNVRVSNRLLKALAKRSVKSFGISVEVSAAGEGAQSTSRMARRVNLRTEVRRSGKASTRYLTRSKTARGAVDCA